MKKKVINNERKTYTNRTVIVDATLLLKVCLFIDYSLFFLLFFFLERTTHEEIVPLTDTNTEESVEFNATITMG